MITRSPSPSTYRVCGYGSNSTDSSNRQEHRLHPRSNQRISSITYIDSPTTTIDAGSIFLTMGEAFTVTATSLLAIKPPVSSAITITLVITTHEPGYYQLAISINDRGCNAIVVRRCREQQFIVVQKMVQGR